MYEIIEIKKSPVHGKGVFAKTDIPKGTEMICDVVIIENEISALPKYQYPWGRNTFSVCLGFGSFFNHSHSFNVKISKIDKIKLTKTFITIKDIKKGEEIFLYYGDNFSRGIAS